MRPKTKLLVFTGVQVFGASSPTCPSQLAPIGRTSNIFTILTNAQVGCVTNVDSYSLYACTYVAGVRHFEDSFLPPGVICCSDKITAVWRKTTSILAASGFQKIANIHVCSTAHLRIRY